MNVRRPCKVDVAEMRAVAIERLSEVFGESPIDVYHVRWLKQYPHSGGPFVRTGHVVMHAFTEFEMDAFTCMAEAEGGERMEIAAVFAAGEFWSIVKWAMDVTMEPLETPEES